MEIKSTSNPAPAYLILQSSNAKIVCTCSLTKSPEKDQKYWFIHYWIYSLLVYSLLDFIFGDRSLMIWSSKWKGSAKSDGWKIVLLFCKEICKQWWQGKGVQIPQIGWRHLWTVSCLPTFSIQVMATLIQIIF